MRQTILSISDLSKTFGGVVATDDLSLDIEQGELHAIIGPNGAGKTTLIAQLSGEIFPDNGRIVFQEKNITVFGISYDSVASQRSFRDKYNLPFILLSDRNHKVGKLYGVDKGLVTARKTFLIRQDGKIVKIYENVSVTTHGEDILEYWSQYKTDSRQ